MRGLDRRSADRTLDRSFARGSNRRFAWEPAAAARREPARADCGSAETHRFECTVFRMRRFENAPFRERTPRVRRPRGFRAAAPAALAALAPARAWVSFAPTALVRGPGNGGLGELRARTLGGGGGAGGPAHAPIPLETRQGHPRHPGRLASTGPAPTGPAHSLGRLPLSLGRFRHTHWAGSHWAGSHWAHSLGRLPP